MDFQEIKLAEALPAPGFIIIPTELAETLQDVKDKSRLHLPSGIAVAIDNIRDLMVSYNLATARVIYSNP